VVLIASTPVCAWSDGTGSASARRARSTRGTGRTGDMNYSFGPLTVDSVELKCLVTSRGLRIDPEVYRTFGGTNASTAVH
jgi:hypothetical protein